jgi:thiol-disulfide isomerase/thioredoxin
MKFTAMARLALVSLLALAATPVAGPARAATPQMALAPDCALTDLATSTPLHLHDLRGKVVYVDFWASWCVPCRDAFPFMNGLAGEFPATQFEVLAVNLDEEVADAKAFLMHFPASFQLALDATKQCPVDFGVLGMPTSFLVDRAGRVRLVHRGFRPGDVRALRDAIRSLIAE